MYRLLPILLCLGVASSAPQTKPDGDSDVTFVKIQPVVEDSAPPDVGKRRESRIENLPLTIPGSINGYGEENRPDEGPNTGQDGVVNSDQDKSLNSGQDGVADSGQDEDGNSTQIDDQNSSQDEENNAQDTPNLTPDGNKESTDVSNLKPREESETKDILPAETNSARQGRNYESYETTELFEIATERYDDVTNPPTSKRPPKFGQTPKLSYFQKPYERVSKNLLEKSPKRRFRSRCRCEKIWNCPKLQISVPRCPNEYFLCCF